MSKMNIELDLDIDLEEGQTIDEFVRDEVINAASKRVEAAIMKTAEARLSGELKVAEQVVEQRVTEITNKVIDDFLVTHRILKYKNSWDKDPEAKTIEQVIFEKIEFVLTRSVDKDGNPTDSSYNRVGTRLDCLIGKLAEKLVDERVKAETKGVKERIEKYILEKFKGEIMEQLSAAVLNNIDFSKIK